MSVEADPETQTAPGKTPVLIVLLSGVFLAAIGAFGGYWAVTSGTLEPVFRVWDIRPVADSVSSDPVSGNRPALPGPVIGRTADPAFVPLETVTISLGPDNPGRHLIFSAELEVAPEFAREVETLTPRILDVLNSYLRVVEVEELSRPTSLARLRAQMLHRIQIVTGDGRVRDLLITQFVVN